MKDKPMEFLTRQFFKDYSKIKAMKRTQKQARTQRETQNGSRVEEKNNKKMTQQTSSFGTCFHSNFQLKFKN